MSIRLAQALQADLPTIEVLDIGAREEGADRYTPLVEQGLARVTGFEPEIFAFERLKARSGPFTYYPHILGDGGPATLYVTSNSGCTSLLEPDPAVIDIFQSIGASPPAGNFLVKDKVQVQTVRLDDVNGLAPPDYIKIDVQGAELMVLRHGIRTLFSATVVQCEVEFLPLYKNQPLFGDMQCFLREQGFVLHKLIDISGRTFIPMLLVEQPHQALSQMLWADAIFVRDFTKLDRWSDGDLLKAALVLNDIYKSFDLVGRLLREHDSRNNGALYERYNQRLMHLEVIPFYLNQKNSY